MTPQQKELYDEMCDECARVIEFITANMYVDNQSLVEKIVNDTERTIDPILETEKFITEAGKALRDSDISVQSDIAQLAAGVDIAIDLMMAMSGKSLQEVQNDIERLISRDSTNDLIESTTLQRTGRIN